MENVTAALAEFIEHFSIGHAPEAVLHQAKRTFLNFIGCAIGGAMDESVTAAVEGLGNAGAPTAAVLGRGIRCEFRTAALLNGVSSAVYSFDDTHSEAVVHAGGPVGSALLALAETRSVSGADALLAYALGVEIVCRVSKAISVAPASAGLGWIQTGICSGIGAALAVGKLLSLNRTQLVWAIGIAASQASGIRGLSRSMCFPLMAGHGARSGIEAALLAQQRFNSVADPLGEQFGFAEIYSEKPNLAAITDGLGERFEILANTFKPYPCGVVIHPVIDACLDLLASIPVRPTDVIGVEVWVNPTNLKLADIPHPADPSEAQMSIQHWVAAAVADRTAGVQQSRPDKLHEPGIETLRGRVIIHPAPETARDGATIAVRLASGDVLRRSIEHCRGSSSRPMTDEEIENKFRAQCAGRVAPDAVDAIASIVWSWEEAADCRGIAEQALGLAPPPQDRGRLHVSPA